MPNLSLLFAEASPIPAHALMALAALVLGSVQLLIAKGTTTHRVLGYAWIALMVGTALSALFIHEIRVWGSFSPIHLLVPVVLVSAWRGIQLARRGDIRRHRSVMLSLFFIALVVTGLFTLLPGRAMHQVVFAGQP